MLYFKFLVHWLRTDRVQGRVEYGLVMMRRLGKLQE